MEEHVSFVSRKGFNKSKFSEKVLQPGITDQDDKGKDVGCTVEEIKYSCEISGPVGDTSTQESENMVDQAEYQALNFGDQNRTQTAAFNSLAGVEEKIDIGSTYKYSSEINTCCKSEENIGPQFGITEESDDICSFNFIGQYQIHVKDVLTELFLMLSNFFLHNKLYIDAVNLSALENETATVLNKCIVVKHPQLALRINGEYMRLVLQQKHIFPDCQINAALMGTKSCIFCVSDCFVTYEIPLIFVLALFRSQCRWKASLLNILIIQSLCQLSLELLAVVTNIDEGDRTLSLYQASPELPEIAASKDISDNVCCVFCAKEVQVKNAGDLKKGQHLTRPGQSHCSFFSYRHHLFLKDIVFISDKTAMLTLIHLTKCGREINIYETVESCNLLNENLNVVYYDNPKYPPEAIIDRAESSVNFIRKAEPDSYNPFYNNCETFVRELMVGCKISLQVRNFLENANILMFLFCIASLFMSDYIGMFTFVAFLIYCFLISFYVVDLSTYCKKGKIICGSCLNDSRINKFCHVAFWTLIFFFLFYHEKKSSYVLDIGCITCVFISSLN